MTDLLGLQTSAYPGCDTPNIGQFIEILRDFMLLGNAVNLINEAADQLNEIAKTVPCCKAIRVHVCFNPGPPPYGLKVGKGWEYLVENLKCIRGELPGTKDCPCTNMNFYWRKQQ